MKCVCGGKTRVKETRGNDYAIYRVRKCLACGDEFVTKEGLKMIRKIFYHKYIKVYNEKKKKGRRK